MAQQTIHHIPVPAHAGWPGGEPASVRAAYDQQAAELSGRDAARLERSGR